ncbi:MAG: CAAX prenyl protease-related protein [Terrimicrobiaceae bacterium]
MKNDRTFLAHAVPFAVFIGFLALVQLVGMLGEFSGIPWLADPKYWIYPLQSIVCAGALVYFWKEYQWGPVVFGAAIFGGIAALIAWVAPEAFLGYPKRTDGFNPDLFAGDPLVYWLIVISRMLRLVVVVPLIEEIFWRGFLQRYLINEDFKSVAFGRFTPLSFFGVAIAFTFVHSGPDWPAAFLTGLIFGWVTIQTKSLFAVVLAHAVTNLGLGIYIMATKQWGYW